MEWLRAYWWWTTSGQAWRFAVGIGGPFLLVAVIFVALALPGSDGEDIAQTLAQTTSTPFTAAGPDPEPTTTLEPTAPTATLEPPTFYTVQPGDSLSFICDDMVPDMASSECVSQIVQLNTLVSAGEIAIGQELALPGGSTADTLPTETTPKSASSRFENGFHLTMPCLENCILQDFVFPGQGWRWVLVDQPASSPILYSGESAYYVQISPTGVGFSLMMIYDEAGYVVIYAVPHGAPLYTQGPARITRGQTIATASERVSILDNASYAISLKEFSERAVGGPELIQASETLYTDLFASDFSP